MTSETRNCQSCKQAFIIEPEDFAFYEKMEVPAPTWCPACRMQRRNAWYNQRCMYRRKCDATGKEIFSMFRADSPHKVYDRDYWWSDKWDPMPYGRDYDFSRSFFEQFRELILAVPMPSRSVIDLENSDYCMNAGQLKNCYMCFDCDGCENCSYCLVVINSKDCIDCYHCLECELCYDCAMCWQCFSCIGCRLCDQCYDVYFSRYCDNCSDCFGCFNLRNKQYCIFNQQYSKEEYFKRLNELWNGSNQAASEAERRVQELGRNFPFRFRNGYPNEDSVGAYSAWCKNVHDSYWTLNGENVRFSQSLDEVKDSYDYSVWGQGAELMYECMQCGNKTYDLKFCYDCYPGTSHAEYCLMCPSSSNLFGCLGLRHQQYCILNKQYSKAEYESLVAKIKEQMMAMPYRDKLGREYRYGDYFPAELSPFAFNETWLYDHFPRSRGEAIREGYSWLEIPRRTSAVDFRAGELPDRIQDAPEDIVKKVIECEHKQACDDGCLGFFKLTTSELAFYRKSHIPIPRICFQCRVKARFQDEPAPLLREHVCRCAGLTSKIGKYTNQNPHEHDGAACQNTFATAWTQLDKRIVYCEQCWKAEGLQ